MPSGRLGSCSPARARRTAADTAAIAASWPMTPLRSASSMPSSFSRSPASIRSTGIPVQRETTLAMSSAVTSSLSIAPALAASASASWRSRSGTVP